MKHISHPIIGNANHGRGRPSRYFAERFGKGRLMLAATDLAFIHPATGAPLQLQDRPEASFLQVLSVFAGGVDEAKLAGWDDRT